MTQVKKSNGCKSARDEYILGGTSICLKKKKKPDMKCIISKTTCIPCVFHGVCAPAARRGEPVGTPDRCPRLHICWTIR